MKPQVLKQPSGFRRDLPLIGVGQCAPSVDDPAHFIGDGSGVVLLLLGGKPLAFVEHKP
jgi:hypothetical protein